MAKNRGAIIIFLTVIVYVIHLVFNALAGKGASSIFPRSISNASDHFELEMTPVGATFSIWGVIFAYQLAWLIYAISTVFRNAESTNILSAKFYISFITNIIFVTIWLVLWTRLEAVPSFIVITVAQVFIDLSIGIACSDLAEFESTHDESACNKSDMWCQRILVQNGLLFYGTWTTVATVINVAVVLSFELGMSTKAASLVALSFLGVLLIMWFILEAFVLTKYTEYTFTAYPALIYGLVGIVAGAWEKDEAVAGLALSFLIVAALFLVIRLVTIVLKLMKRGSYESIQYDARNQKIQA